MIVSKKGERMLTIKNLAFAYEKEFVLNDFNLTVEKNKKVAILGDSGSGKSTLLRLIAGLEKATAGEILIEGKIVNSLPPELRKVGMVFQDYALFPHMSVYQNVAFSLKNKKDKSFVDELLKVTDIYRYKDKYPHQLSGGEKQRVALSRSLCYRPKLLLLDEPFSNLDASLKTNLRLKIKEILAYYNITTIIVTHDKDDAMAIADEYYYMKKGKIEYLSEL